MKATKVSKKKKKKTRKEWKLKGERKEEELPADIFECIEHGLGIEFYREALENTPNFMVERSPENGWLPIHFFVRKNMNKLSAVEAEKNPVLFDFWALPIFRFFIVTLKKLPDTVVLRALSFSLVVDRPLVKGAAGAACDCLPELGKVR